MKKQHKFHYIIQEIAEKRAMREHGIVRCHFCLRYFEVEHQAKGFKEVWVCPPCKKKRKAAGFPIGD